MTIGRGVGSVFWRAATFTGVHSAGNRCLLLSASTGYNAEERNVRVPGPVKVTAETQKHPSDAASALSSLRLN